MFDVKERNAYIELHISISIIYRSLDTIMNKWAHEGKHSEKRILLRNKSACLEHAFQLWKIDYVI